MNNNQKLSQLLLPEFTVKLIRGVKQNCQICHSSFTVFTKQHICKRCLRSVCYDCSPFKVKTYLGNRQIRLHRNCTFCQNQINAINQYINGNKLKWNDDSDLLFLWSRLLKDRKFAKLRRKSNLLNYVSLQNLWLSFNYSFRDFLSIIIQKANINDIQLLRVINDGLQQIKNHFQQHLEDGLYIYLYFLCHCQMEIAVNLTLIILELIHLNSMNQEFIDETIRNVGFSQIQAFKIKQFIVDNQEIFKCRLGINVLPVWTNFHIINSVLISNNLNYFWKGIVYLLLQRKNQVIKNINKINSLTLDLLRNTCQLNIQTGLKEVMRLATSQADQNSQQLRKQCLELKLKHEEMLKQINQLKNNLQNMSRQQAINEFGLGIKSIKQNSVQNNFNLINELNRFSINNSTDVTQIDYQVILQMKNQQIIRLKANSEQVLIKYYNKKQELQRTVKQLELKNAESKEKDSQLRILQNQNSQLKLRNNLLLKKIEQLSNLLMDQEQNAIKLNHETLLKMKNQIEQELQTTSNKEQCNIY